MTEAALSAEHAERSLQVHLELSSENNASKKTLKEEVSGNQKKLG